MVNGTSNQHRSNQAITATNVGPKNCHLALQVSEFADVASSLRKLPVLKPVLRMLNISHGEPRQSDTTVSTRPSAKQRGGTVEVQQLPHACDRNFGWTFRRRLTG